MDKIKISKFLKFILSDVEIPKDINNLKNRTFDIRVTIPVESDISIENPNWDYDSVSKHKYIKKNRVLIINHIIPTKAQSHDDK